jgi:hypothetical protein
MYACVAPYSFVSVLLHDRPPPMIKHLSAQSKCSEKPRQQMTARAVSFLEAEEDESDSDNSLDHPRPLPRNLMRLSSKDLAGAEAGQGKCATNCIEILSVALILSNTVSIAWAVQAQAENGEEPSWAIPSELFFCVTFSLELLLRCLFQGFTFLFKAAKYWTLLDVIVVVEQLLQGHIGNISAL